MLNIKSSKSEKNSQSQKTVTRSVKLTRKQHLCAATPGVVDACVGDSGGPLDCWDRKRERQTIAGVVSFGKNCASETYAGVYTNVPFYATWIRLVCPLVPLQEPLVPSVETKILD